MSEATELVAFKPSDALDQAEVWADTVQYGFDDRTVRGAGVMGYCHGYKAGREAARASSWVRCADRLPEELHDVITCTGDVVEVGWYHGAWYDKNDGEIQPTHWQPLPAPPVTT